MVLACERKFLALMRIIATDIPGWVCRCTPGILMIHTHPVLVQLGRGKCGGEGGIGRRRNAVLGGLKL